MIKNQDYQEVFIFELQALTKMSIDTCRLCLKDGMDMENILSLTYKTEKIKPFVKCINKVLNFEVRDDDGFPIGVCQFCIESIKYMYDLRKKFRGTQKSLYGNFRWKQQHVFHHVNPNTKTKVLSDQSKVETLIKDESRMPLELQCENLDPVVYIVPLEKSINLYNYQQVSKTVYKRMNPNKIIKSSRTNVPRQSCCGCYQNSKMCSNDNLIKNSTTAESCRIHNVCNKTIDKKPVSHRSRSVARNSDKALKSKRSISPNKGTKYARIEYSDVKQPAKVVLLSDWEDFVASLESTAFK